MLVVAEKEVSCIITGGAGQVFFSVEKNQKTFTTLSRPSQAAPTPEFAKVFCFFSSEKKTFLNFLTAADERRVQDLSGAPIYAESHARNPERGVHLPPQGSKEGLLF